MRIFSLLLLVSTLTLSCSNEFELNAPYKDTTVVYGFINQDDPVHYIRVEKAFIDDETSALEIAKNPDSLYADNILVQLVRLDKNDETITLERINGDEVGLAREEGIFATAPNILYGFSLPDEEKLEGQERVELRISLGDDKEPVTAQTEIIGDIEFQQGRPSEDNFNFLYENNANFVWFARQGGQLFDLILDINFQELDPNDNNQFKDRTLRWVVQRNIRRERPDLPQVRVDVPGVLFYQFLQDQLENEPRRQRFFNSIDVNVIATGQELVDFLDVTRSNTGITSAQEVPTFTNLEGDGVGLLTSRKEVVTQIKSLGKDTRDSLKMGIYTRGLNFQ